MRRLVREMDWSRTPLGPMETWPQSLRVAVGICLHSRFPMFVWWGPQLINIYNDAYIPVLGKRHPDALGRPAQSIWGEIWHVVGPQAEAVMQRGEATWNDRSLLVMQRHGYTEDTYFTWSYSPIPDESGGVGGLFCACTEETPRVLAERERDRLVAQLDAERTRLADIFHRSPSFTCVLRGPQHVFEMANERYYQVIGHREIIGKPVREALPEVEGQGFFELLDHVFETGEPFVGQDMRILVQRERGQPMQPRYLEFVYQPLRDADGAVGGIVVHGIDLTERKHVEEALRRRSQSLKLLADTSVRLLMDQDPDAIVTDLFRRLAAHLGLDVYFNFLVTDDESRLELHASAGVDDRVRERIRYLDFGEGVCGTVAQERTGRVLEDVQNSDEPRASLVRSLGMTCYVCQPLLAQGRLIGTLSFGSRTRQRFTPEELNLVRTASDQVAMAMERQRLTAELHRRAEELARANAAKDEFLAVLSHELRTPLTPVLLTVSLMEANPALPQSLREDVATIRRNVELESRLISDLLDLTRIARGKLQLDEQNLDLHLLVRSAIDICQREASARLIVELNARHHLVRGDSTRLQQVFWNLINNAMKFTGPEGTITVRSSDAPHGRVRVEVIDNGVGIDPDLLPKLFSAFEQGDVRTKRRQAGLGLGLAISRTLVEAHGGTVSAASEGRGRGATFTVELPAEAEVFLPVAAPKPAPLLEIASRSLKVLLVEDHEPTLRVMTKLLAALGHDVTGATTVATATTAAMRDGFDLIISDLGLPDGSGLDIMRQVRSRYAGRAIALTGYGMEADIAASSDAGFTEHLTKPVDLDALESAIRRVAAGAPAR